MWPTVVCEPKVGDQPQALVLTWSMPKRVDEIAGDMKSQEKLSMTDRLLCSVLLSI